MTYLQKYLLRYNAGCKAIIEHMRRASVLPLDKESIDDRIKAFDAIILGLQEAKRTLLFFKNTVGLPPPPPKPPGDDGPGAA